MFFIFPPSRRKRYCESSWAGKLSIESTESERFGKQWRVVYRNCPSGHQRIGHRAIHLSRISDHERITSCTGQVWHSVGGTTEGRGNVSVSVWGKVGRDVAMTCFISAAEDRRGGHVWSPTQVKVCVSAFTAGRRRAELLFLPSKSWQAAQNGSSLLNGIFYDNTSSPLGGAMEDWVKGEHFRLLKKPLLIKARIVNDNLPCKFPFLKKFKNKCMVLFYFSPGIFGLFIPWPWTSITRLSLEALLLPTCGFFKSKSVVFLSRYRPLLNFSWPLPYLLDVRPYEPVERRSNFTLHRRSWVVTGTTRALLDWREGTVRCRDFLLLSP